MTAVDYVVLGVIALSVLVSVLRGALREVMAIGAWVGSLCLAAYFGPGVAAMLPAKLSDPGVRLAVAFGAILLAGLLLFALVSVAVAQLLRRSGLAGADRVLGALFGLIRAVVILVCLTLAAGLTDLPREPAWRDALSSPPLEALARAVRGHLPSALATRISYD